MDERSRKYLSAFICDLRDVADGDYIAARTCHRLTLLHPAVWLASQAVEKYLKAILLFQCRSVKHKRYRSHDLMPLLEAVQGLPLIGFELPEGGDKFVQRVSEEGPNRYRDFQMTIDTMDVFQLDRLVWHIRRYCQDFLLMPGDETRYPGESAKRLSAIPSVQSNATLSTFAIEDGHLERVLTTHGAVLRDQRGALTWRNRFYGLRKKEKIRFVRRLGFSRPVHMMRPEILAPILEPLVHFPADVREWLKEQQSRKRVTTEE